MPKSYTPLRYPGGKVKMYSFILDVLEYNNLNNITYIEPYAGGAGLALKLLLTNKVDRIVLNDIDKNIYSFWYLLLNHNEELIERTLETQVTIKEWEKQRLIYNNYKSHNLRDIGFATFFLNRTNFSGVLAAGPIGGRDQSGNFKLDCRFNKKRLIQLFKEIYLQRERIVLSNLDALDFMLDSKNLMEDKNSFSFIDPPYFVKGKALYLNFYEKKDHQNLADAIRKIEGNWIVTYDHVEEIMNFYKKQKFIQKHKINYSLMEKTKATEIIIYSNHVLSPQSKAIEIATKS